MKLHLGDIVAYQAVDHLVEGIVDYSLGDRVFRLVAMVADGRTYFLEPVVLADRVLLFSEIPLIDINSPPPATICHHGESYLLKMSGEVTVSIAGHVAGRIPGTCRFWRFRAAGGQFLQIEEWPDGIRMLAGTAIHKGMLEIRPARL